MNELKYVVGLRGVQNPMASREHGSFAETHEHVCGTQTESYSMDPYWDLAWISAFVPGLHIHVK